MELPDPISNSEVKRRSAEDTCAARCWENRSLPGFLFSVILIGNYIVLLSMAKKVWKGERASYSKVAKPNYRSNKYRTISGADQGKKPKSGARKRAWVGGYVRKGGVKVKGHYRKTAK